MVTLAARQVVVLPFPFSDLSRKKLRPALLLADAGKGDWIACQITSDLAAVVVQPSSNGYAKLTSNSYADSQAITLSDSEFATGGLQRLSYLRPGKLFTCHESLPVNTVGALNKTTLQQARTAVIQMIQG
jgi:mRNA interferase MazF